MSRDKDLRLARNKAIREAFKRLENEKVHGVQKYRHEAILHMLSKKFWLAPKTIQEILLEDDEEQNQLNLFETK